jgi:hypothetical protein
MDQLPAEVFVGALADSEQFWLAAGGELPRNETKPRSEIAPTVEPFPRPTAATSADATIAPIPGIGVNWRAFRSPSPSGRTRRRKLRSVDRPIASGRRHEPNHPGAEEGRAIP